MSEDVKKKLQLTYDAPPFVLTEYVPEPVAINRPPKGKLRMDKLLLNIPKSNEINCQEQIAFIEDDVVVVTSKDPQHVMRLNDRGEVVARYYPEMKGEGVNGVSVYDNRIYIVQEKAITVVPQRYGEGNVVYTPDVPNIDKIIVVDKSTIFISEWYMPGNVYRYNIESNQTEVVVKTG